MSAWVRNGVLMGADELVAELGGDLTALRREAGLEPLDDPDFPIPASAVVEFLERAASVCACEAFGLLLSQKQDFSIFGPLWPFFRSASTVGEVLHDVAEFFPVHTQGALVAIEKTPDGAVLRYDLAAGVAQSRRQVIELGVGFVTTQLRRLRPIQRRPERDFDRPRDAVAGIRLGRWERAWRTRSQIQDRPRDPARNVPHARRNSRSRPPALCALRCCGSGPRDATECAHIAEAAGSRADKLRSNCRRGSRGPGSLLPARLKAYCRGSCRNSAILRDECAVARISPMVWPGTGTDTWSSRP
jgi:Arabinose-binding domain of AraC transcription regulator, N-term